MAPPALTSRDKVEESIMAEISEACHVPENRIEDIYACTPLQISTMAESMIRTGASVFQFVLSLSSSVDLDKFCEALRRVVSLNAILRTRLVDCHLGLVQVITGEEHSTQRRHTDFGQYLREDKASPLGLGVPLFRCAIINDCKLVLTMHHAIMDHSSMAPFLRDVLCAYQGETPETRPAFKRFVEYCISIDESAARSFWGSRFSGSPVIFPRVDRGYLPNATEKEGRKIALNQIGAGVSPAHVPSFIEAAWALTAGLYASSESVAFGLVLSGRTPSLAGIESTLGPTIATIPVQVNFQRKTVEGLLKEMTTARRELQTNPDLQYGIAKIRTVSEAARIASGFQTLINIRPTLSDPSESTDLSYEYMDEPQGAFSLCLSCNLMNDGIFVEAMSDPAIICRVQLSRILYQFEHTLHSLMEAPSHTKLEQLPKLSPQDRSEILHWNRTVPEAVERCVHELFGAQAEETPTATAVEAWDGTATYHELNDMSTRLAYELRDRGVATGSSVAFVFEKSLWTVVAIFAIMKAGGTCVPIERSDPRARKAAIVSSADVKIVLTSSAEYANSIGLTPDVFAVNSEAVSRLPDVTKQLDGTSPEDLAYIIFTSGSTGLPKGVMLEHCSLASSLRSLGERFGWQPDCRMLQFAAHVWDISMGEIFGALLSGGCLCIPSEEDRQSNLVNFIESNKVNWAWLTPTVLRTMSPEEVPSLQSLLSIGEPVDAGAAKTWGRALRFINGWGPCEASILSAVAELTPDSRYPESIGTPVGCALWIVNAGKPNELTPIGAVGELLVEGPGVARGYLKEKAKTAAAFIQPPPWDSRENKSKHVFRTGDLAMYNPDGNICFIGRRDNQVKIRGQRFELGELESVIASSSEVREVFTTTKISQGRTELVTVICLADPLLPRGKVLKNLADANPGITAQRLRAIRDHAESKLPSFMVPSIWLAVEQMPRTASAKLDREMMKEWLKKKDISSTRANLGEQAASTLTPPNTADERLMQAIWASVLAVPEEIIGRESHFLELGGDSILAMQVASRCRKYGVQTTTAALLSRTSLADIAKSSTVMEHVGENAISSKKASPDGRVSELGAAISKAFETRASKLDQSNRHFRSQKIEHIAPATDVQALMLSTGQARDKGYYIDFTLDFTPALNTAKLRDACERVIQHHAILRTVFVPHGQILYQVVLKGLSSEMVIKEEKPTAIDTFPKGTPLARFHLISDDQLCHRLCLEIHHALYDAISLDLIFRDLHAAYRSKPLSEGPQFHFWVSHVEASDGSAPRVFWSETLQGSSMPYLVPNPGTIRGYPLDEIIKFRVPLQNMQTRFGTPSSVMKAAWALLLSSALGSNDVVFGEISANRYSTNFPGVDQVRGPCINSLPARARLDRKMTLASLITQMQDQTTAALPYHSLGFRSIVKDCTDWPSWTRFSTAMVYQNHGLLNHSFKIGDTDCALSNEGKLGESADIWAIAMPGAQELEVELRSSTHTFPSENINWISRCLAMILETMPSRLEKTLDEIDGSLHGSLGSYMLPKNQQDYAVLLNGHARHSSPQARETVSQAWNELDLLSGEQDENISMFPCGADVVTALLLSEYYQESDLDIIVTDIVQYSSRSQQAYLVDSKTKAS